MNVMVFDTETTGLPKHPSVDISKQPKIIEFGAVILDENGEIVKSYNQLINPQEQIESIITKITGITNDDLIGKPVFKDVWPEIMALFNESDLMVAHNLAFDRGLVGFELRRMGIDFKFPTGVCTVEENRARYGYRPKMVQLYADVCGHALAQTHRAIDDCTALAEIWTTGGFHATFIENQNRM